MSVCAGFSEVFHQFCSVAGIVELPLGGYARGIGFLGQKWSEKDDPTQSNHAWNIVKVGQYWYLIDVTWDSGSTSKGKRDDYYTNIYLFPKPEEFIFSHFPTDPQFQFLNPPLTPKQFSNSPYSTPSF